LFRGCYSPALDTNTQSLFNLTINGVLQPQSSYILRPVGYSPPACPGLNSVFYQWTLNSPGTTLGSNVIKLVYTNNGITLSDTRSVIVTSPFQIAGLSSNNQLVMWGSVPGATYQVLATTNLSQPFQPISTNIPSQGTNTSFFDPNPSPQKFYEIEIVP
jgi:hypothetical protein